MKRSEFRKLIRECLQEVLSGQIQKSIIEQSDDWRTKHDNLKNNSPKVDIKVYDTIGNGNFVGHANHIFDVKNLALHAMTKGSGASLHGTIGDQEISGTVTKHDLKMLLKQFGYPAEESPSLNESFDKNQLSREVGKYLSKKLQGKVWPSFDDFQTVLNSRRTLSMLQKYPVSKAAYIAGDMILAVASKSLKEDKIKAIQKILSEDTEYPEHEWTKVSGYIEGYCAIPDNDELFEDGLQDAISDAISSLQDSEIINIQVKEVNTSLKNSNPPKSVFHFKVEFLYSVHPSSQPEEGVQEVLQKIPGLASKPAPKTDVSTDLGGFDRPIKEESVDQKSPIDGKSKPSVVNWLRKSIDPIVSGFFTDNSWAPIQNVREFMGKNNIDFSIISSEYKKYQDGSHLNDAKQWKFEIKFVNNKQKLSVINGIITAHGAGSVSDPLSRYDVTVVMS